MKLKKVLATTAVALTVIGTPFTALAAPKTMADGTVFDAEFYAKQYPDVAAVFGTDEAMLYSHYVNFGKKEGRLPAATTTAAITTTTASSDFDAVYYAAKYPDVAKAFGNNAALLKAHYDTAGKAEGRYANAAEEAAATAAKVTTTTTTATTESAQEKALRYANEAVTLINKVRSSANRHDLMVGNAIREAAFTRAKELAEKNDHIRPNGADFKSVFGQYGVSITGAEELIISGVSTPAEAVRYWERYKEKKEIITDEDYDRLAVGYYEDANKKSYWVALFVDFD